MSTSTKNEHVAPADASVVVSARLFAAVAGFRSVHDIRYYLNGVHVTPCEAGGVFIVATDGHQMCVAHDPDGRATEPVILMCTKSLDKAVRERAHSDEAVVIVQSNRVRLLDPHEIHVQAGDAVVVGKFPDFLKIMEGGIAQPDQGLSGFFAGALMKKLGKAAGIVSKKYCGLTHWTTKEGYLLTRYSADKNIVVITMPIRDDCSYDGPLPGSIAQAVSKAKVERLAKAEADKAATANVEA